MHIEIFETFQDGKGMEKLNTLLAQDGKTISVDKIFTAASATEHYSRHFVTVIYFTLEQPPKDLQPSWTKDLQQPPEGFPYESSL